jgi:hypothetical protein
MPVLGLYLGSALTIQPKPDKEQRAAEDVGIQQSAALAATVDDVGSKRLAPAAAATGSKGPGPPKKKQKKRDPNMPRGPRHAHNFWVSGNRQVVKNDLGTSAQPAAVTQELSNRWKALSAEGKKPSQELAALDKVRYEKEMEDYSPPEDEDLDTLIENLEEPVPLVQVTDQQFFHPEGAGALPKITDDMIAKLFGKAGATFESFEFKGEWAMSMLMVVLMMMLPYHRRGPPRAGSPGDPWV